MIAFAVGGLLGDVFFHTIPHMNSHSHQESHNYDGHHSNEHSHEDHHGHSHNPKEMENNMIIIIGIISFFIIEKVSVTLL